MKKEKLIKRIFKSKNRVFAVELNRSIEDDEDEAEYLRSWRQ